MELGIVSRTAGHFFPFDNEWIYCVDISELLVRVRERTSRDSLNNYYVFIKDEYGVLTLYNC